MDIKPIETVYKGYRFRSRLEARWAVFFDTGKIKWEYEPEGFENESGDRYLPDFYLPEFDMYVEVKPNNDGRIKELEKIDSILSWGGPIKAVLILPEVPYAAGEGMWHFLTRYYCPLRGPAWGVWLFHDDGEPNITGHMPGEWSENHILRCMYKVGGIGAISDRLIREARREAVLGEDWFYKYQEDANPLTFMAYRKARGARFEHGEKG